MPGFLENLLKFCNCKKYNNLIEQSSRQWYNVPAWEGIDGIPSAILEIIYVGGATFFMLKKWSGILILLLMFPLAAHAAKITDLWVTGAVYENGQTSGNGENVPDDSIHWWYSGKTRKYYLFLPAGADISGMRIWFKSAAESIDMGGKTIESGGTADFLKPGTEIIVDAGNRYTLAVMQSKNIPAMFISTESGSLNKINSSKDYEETGNMVLLSPDGTLAYHGPLSQVKGRGNSTFAYPKKPYQIKLPESYDLCGMGKAKTWILLANYMDSSLLRNTVTFALARAAGLPYTSKSQAVDLYINNNYLGSYLLCEKVEIGDERVAITDLEKATEAVNEKSLEEYPPYGLDIQFAGKSKGFSIPNNPEDITGGYLLELEKPYRYTPEAGGFKTRKGLPVVIKEPEHVSRAQADYISAIIQSLENAIFSEDGVDPKSGKRYTELVDMDSLVKKYIVDEISKNFDANRTSFFLYKPADDKSTQLFAGPVWDYDIGYGNFETERSKSLLSPSGFSANKDRAMDFYWFPELYTQDDFYKRVVQIYHESFVPVLRVLLGMEKDPTGIVLSLDEYALAMEASAAMNFSRWKMNITTLKVAETGRDYLESIAYLKEFLAGRMAFLSENWPLE
jgi:hypothetical protein